jgi:hypothetical protein
MTAHLCSPRVYQYQGYTFELGMMVCAELKKNGDPRIRMRKGFYDMIREFQKLSESEREQYRIGGGCVRVKT